MKKGIHPKMYDATVTCACGAQYKVKSTKKEMRVEVCAQCHPFYTGVTSKLVDTTGRVEKFNRKYKRKKSKR